MEPRVEALPELLSSEIFLPFKDSFRNGFRKAMLLSNIGIQVLDLEKQYCLDSFIIIDHFADFLQPIL